MAGPSGGLKSAVASLCVITGTLGALLSTYFMLFTPGSSRSILPARIEQYAVTPRYTVPNASPRALVTRTQNTATCPRTTAHSDTSQPSALVIHNYTDRLVYGDAAGQNFDLGPGEKICINASPGHIEIRAQTPGARPMYQHTVLKPSQVSTCTLLLFGT